MPTFLLPEVHSIFLEGREWNRERGNTNSNTSLQCREKLVSLVSKMFSAELLGSWGADPHSQAWDSSAQNCLFIVFPLARDLGSRRYCEAHPIRSWVDVSSCLAVFLNCLRPGWGRIYVYNWPCKWENMFEIFLWWWGVSDGSFAVS